MDEYYLRCVLCSLDTVNQFILRDWKSKRKQLLVMDLGQDALNFDLYHLNREQKIEQVRLYFSSITQQTEQYKSNLMVESFKQ